MYTKLGNQEWEVYNNYGKQPMVDIVIERPGYTNPDLVELTREDLENMLSALDNLEATNGQHN